MIKKESNIIEHDVISLDPENNVFRFYFLWTNVLLSKCGFHRISTSD